VREIAGQDGVSIATARKALGVLAEAGLIVVTPGWGAFRSEP
jgi:DNA-binding GntR family transcriptional regulator